MPRRAALLGFALLAMTGCANAPEPPPVLYSLDGPPLAVAGEQGQNGFTGRMERACLAGPGLIEVESGQVICRGNASDARNQSGHRAALLTCERDEALMLAFRPLGPDQGIGVGYFVNGQGVARGEPLIFFFHPWAEEAERRLHQEKDTLLKIINQREQQ